jgi:hypothetical protein
MIGVEIKQGIKQGIKAPTCCSNETFNVSGCDCSPLGSNTDSRSFSTIADSQLESEIRFRIVRNSLE